jgi:hypothetical protein
MLHVNASKQNFNVSVRLARTPLSPVFLKLDVPNGWDGTPLATISSVSLKFLPPSPVLAPYESTTPPSPPYSEPEPTPISSSLAQDQSLTDSPAAIEPQPSGE